MLRRIVGICLAAAVSLPASADDSWYGIVKREPGADSQQWLVGSRPVNPGSDAQISTDVGPLDIGACVRISGAEGRVEELSTRAMSHCDKTDYEAYFAQYRAIADKADANGVRAGE